MQGIPLLRTITLILSFCATAAGISLDITQFMGQQLNWGWLALGSFIVFLAMIGWTIYDQYKEIRKLKDTRPIVKSELQATVNDGVGIIIKNEGAVAGFQAQIEVLKHTDNYLPQDWLRYYGYWNQESDILVAIMKGMSNYIKLATFEISAHTSTGCLCFYKSTPQGLRTRNSYSYLVSAPKGCLIPEYLLRITVSSSPVAVEGPKIFMVRIRADGAVEEIKSIPIKSSWIQKSVFRKTNCL